ncbi:hypothetical protein BO70DRAFT_156854 [Aspergillus heteromorphus CBS 117.55]|uniref:Uncharacterized protein n=1 Tax=Aspergillus heteromorphus CBS 117.55 TaxID=1448321 RepID=A0A317WR36_9EURO|nr:uncharacterized protein BO70DRAFT_156854 [Aspergillus heteromorphus CBS 117.55]PWY88909.1 hypothetical protein BO70DRAFT_156854 [Aspergillus heteromorphus CBS 117.55]
MALTGDMPQQAKNSGMLSYSADIGCRTCYCPRSKQYQWSYDTVSHGRYHFQHQYYRTEGDHKATVPEQQRYFNAAVRMMYRTLIGRGSAIVCWSISRKFLCLQGFPTSLQPCKKLFGRLNGLTFLL